MGTAAAPADSDVAVKELVKEPVEAGGPKVIHFFSSDVPEAQRIGPLGLSEFCNVMVEEYEDELAEAISKATSAAKTGLFAGMYEMKESVCVATAGACKSEQLNTITAHRIGQARNMSPEKMRQLQEAMAQSEAVPADPAHKDEV